MRPQRRAVVSKREVVLDVALRAEHQRLCGLAGGQVLDVLRGQAVQPGQPVLPGDAQDAPVRAVDLACVAGQRSLLRRLQRSALGGGSLDFRGRPPPTERAMKNDFIEGDEWGA